MSEILGFIDINDYGLQSMVAGAGKMQDKTATPTTSQQVIEPDQGYDGMSSVTINAVTSAIDENIIPTNIRAGVSVLGVQGNLEPDKPDQSKTVNPSTTQQVIVADTGYELAQVTVEPMSLQSKDVTITENGTTTVTPDTGYDGLSDIDVTVEGILDTSDATAVAGDMASEKTAYVNGVKITGNLPTIHPNVIQYVTPSMSSGQIFVHGQVNSTKGILPAQSYMTMGAGVTSVAQVAGLTANKLKKDEVVLGITGTYEGEKVVLPDGVRFYTTTATNMDWLADVDTSQITSFSAFFRSCRQITSLPYFDASNGTNFSQMCQSALALVSFPQIDTSNGTNFYQMFAGCQALVDVPVLDWSKATSLQYAFGVSSQDACTNLSNESLNNILEMCANATAYIQQGTNMTLRYIGLTSAQATTCQTLSNWDAFVAAGWSSGV